MAKHKVHMSTPLKTVLNVDTEFKIYRNDKKYGTLKISRGTVEWLPANHSYGYHVSWEAFDKFMKKDGRRKKTK